jgi:hypothetical protein
MSGEPSHFNAQAIARWSAGRGRPHAKRQPAGPRPTLGDLQHSHCWTWVYCEKCLQRAPMALVPLIVRWGADTSSDRLRQRARSTKCGPKGATTSGMGGHAHRVSALPLTRTRLRCPPAKIRYYDARTDTHLRNWGNSTLLDERAGRNDDPTSHLEIYVMTLTTPPRRTVLQVGFAAASVAVVAHACSDNEKEQAEEVTRRKT